MTNAEIKEIISMDDFFKVITNNGETFIGIIDGPYAGYAKAKLEDYRRDYVYVTLLNNQQQPIRVHSDSISRIEKFIL